MWLIGSHDEKNVTVARVRNARGNAGRDPHHAIG